MNIIFNIDKNTPTEMIDYIFEKDEERYKKAFRRQEI